MPNLTTIPVEQVESECQPEVEKQSMLLTVRLDKGFYHEISEAAWKLRTTRAGLARTAIQKYLESLKAETLAA